MIPKSDLNPGAFYRGSCRNASVAQWNGTRFVYLRTKFGTEFLEDINHPEDDDGFDLFEPEAEIPLQDILRKLRS